LNAGKVSTATIAIWWKKLASPLVGDRPRSTLVSPQSFREKGVSSGRLRHLDRSPPDL
jgi:hypothetical protein